MAHRPAHEHLLAALLESSEEAVVSVSFDGRIETWSAGAQRLYGYTAREMIGESLGVLLPPDETKEQAQHDGLTGLANYREFMDRLTKEVNRAERNRRSFTLLLLDLDDLKRINDLQGHLTGNRALRRLAAVMNEHCRSTDLAARYGGDEFAVLLIDSDCGMTEHVAKRIEHSLRSDPERPQLSASIGIGVYPDDGRTPAEIIEPRISGSTGTKKARRSVASLLLDHPNWLWLASSRLAMLMRIRSI